ncbi:MAG: hypothetical protein GX575_12695 [Candidatus Anammoximicrobium sp.]|nr:hypothetical protein [Candidatus Anammoximicrobium sp.]
MHAYELIELSALIAVNGQSFVRSPSRLPEASVSQYWSVSRARFDRWARTLMTDLDRLRSCCQKAPSACCHARPVLEEIFTGELLTRIWTAVACQHDRQWGTSYVSPIVRSVFLGHLEARNRALNFMFHAQDHDLDAVLAINRVRNRSERWTDMLLAYLTPLCDVAKVAFERKRVVDFAEDVRDLFRQPNAAQSWQLLQGALHNSFGDCLAENGPNSDLNAQLASSILAGFRLETFDATGELGSLWMQRIEYTTATAESLIEELLAIDAPQARPRGVAARRQPQECA